MRTILVTGGAGFIGSHLVRHLIQTQRYRVINLDKLTYAGNLSSLVDVEASANYHFVQADIGDRTRVGQVLQDHCCDGVLNLAAESHVDRSIDSPAAFVQTNVVGTFQLLEAVREYWQGLPESQAERFRFVQVSTDEVFGSLGEAGAFTETTAYQPNSPYSASKASGDHFVRSYHHTFGLPTITTHGSNNYGPFQFPEKLIPLMIGRALTGKPLPIYGDGSNVRDWLHVEDHCRALHMILESGRSGETYNIGGGGERSNLQVVQMICEAVDRMTCAATPTCHAIQFVPDRPGHDFRYAIDASKLSGEIGWRPTIALEDGIAATVQWYLRNQAWVAGTHERGHENGRGDESRCVPPTSCGSR